MNTKLFISSTIRSYMHTFLVFLWNFFIGILFYRMVHTIEKSIKIKKIDYWDIGYIFLNLQNQYLFFRTSSGVGIKLYARITLFLMLFFALDIMYKEKILCKKSDKENTENKKEEEKPHVN